MLNKKLSFWIILSMILIIFSVPGQAVDYKYTQESGAGFKVNADDKSDALEDTNEIRQIVEDLGTLLVHSKNDDSYPKDATTGGTLAIPNSALALMVAGAKGDILYCSAANVWGKLNVGADDKILVVATDLPNWETASSDLLSDVAFIGMLDETDTITANWVNTAFPWADNEVANDITINLATLATTLTVSDNEVTNEDNAILFTSGGVEAGDLNIESDGGDFHYNPSTGTLTVTEIVGGGAGLTGVTATITGADTYVTFFDGADSPAGEAGFTYIKGTDTLNVVNISCTSVTGALTGNADTVTNATFTTALTVNTGTLTLTANVADNSVLTIGAGAVDVSGSNTGDQDLSGYALKGANTDLTSILNAALYVGRDVDNNVSWAVDDTLTIEIAGVVSSIIDIETGVGDNNSLVTQGYVDDAVAAGVGYTNLTSFVTQTAWRVFYSNTDGDVVELALGADGTFLKSNGAAVAPTFEAPAGGGDALVANPLSQFAATTSAELAGVISDETGTDKLVYNTSPTFVTPLLGTPTSGTLTSCTGLPYSGLADGTDGNLITWSAAGTAALVATGDATQVLTSNGVGTAPTFQDAAVSGANTALSNLAAVAINLSLVSDAADTDSLGTVDAEWLNLYIGDAGKIYLGLGQDLSIHRSAANTMTLTASTGVLLTGPLTTPDVYLPTTLHATETGIIYKNSNPFLHDFSYGNNGTATPEGFNTFVGVAGNLTMGATATQAYHSSYVTAMGYQAGLSNETGYGLTFVGYAAGKYNTTGKENTFVGDGCGALNTTGERNSNFGQNAGGLNTTGSNNVFIGDNAGYHWANGATALIPNSSVYIGALSKGKDNDDSNSIVIGYDAIGLGANTTVIGNTSTTATYLYGDVDIPSGKTYKIDGTALAAANITGAAASGANTDITSLQNAALYIGRDVDNFIGWAVDDSLAIEIGGVAHAIVSISTGAADNDKLCTQGYADDAAAGGGATVALNNLAAVQINTTLLSDAADTDSLGTTAAEWLNLYIGDAGKIYLGLGQDVELFRSAANTLTITASTGVLLTGPLGVTGTRVSKGWFAALESTADITINGTALAAIYASIGANTDITSLQNAALFIGRDADNTISFATDDHIIFETAGATNLEIDSTGELDMNANSVGFTLQSDTGDGATTIDWKLGNHYKFTHGAMAETFTFTAPTNPCTITLIIIQDGTGSRDSTWPGTVKWLGTEPTWADGGASKGIVVGFIWDGTNYWGQATPWET